MSEKEGDIVKKITLFALMLLTLFTMSFLASSVYAEGDSTVYRNVRYHVEVEEVIGEPFMIYDGTGRVKVSFEDGQLELTLIVDGKGSLTDGRKIIKLKPKNWQFLTDQLGYQIAAGFNWFHYTPTNVTWLGNGEALEEEGRYMGFSFRYYYYPEHQIPNPSISIATLPANYPPPY